MPYAGNRIPANRSVACILTETLSFINLIRPINRHQATCFPRALKETRARLANNEGHENKKTTSLVLCSRKRQLIRHSFGAQKKRGLLWVLNISCDKVLEVTQMFGHDTFILSTVMIGLDITHCPFISLLWTRIFRRC